MSITSVDNIQDLINAAKETSPSASKDKERDPNAKDDSQTVSFDALLRNRLSGNVAFTNINVKTTVPERAQTEFGAAPVVERRDTRTDTDTGNDDFGDTADLDAGPEQAQVSNYQRSDDSGRAAPVQNTDKDTADTSANTGDRNQSQGRGDDAAARKTTEKAGGNENVRADARTTAANTAANQAGLEIELADLPSSKGKNNAQANVKVTKEAAEIASQPQANLTAKAAVEAETAKVAKRGQHATSALNDEVDVEFQESGQNVFNRAKSNAAAQAANQGRQDANGAKTQTEGNTQGQAAQQAQNANNQAQNATFQNALNAGKAASANSNAGQQQSVSVDAATGGTSVSGQNNAVQQRSAPTQTPQSANRTPTPHTPLADQVAVNIQRGIAQGQDRITVQLKPQELGRVEIKMEMSHDGRMTAVIAAERPETLDMLRQDSRSLLEALNQAGLKADENSLSFNLQGQGAGDGNGQADAGTAGGQAEAEEPELPSLFDDIGDLGGYTPDGRLDFRI